MRLRGLDAAVSKHALNREIIHAQSMQGAGHASPERMPAPPMVAQDGPQNPPLQSLQAQRRARVLTNMGSSGLLGRVLCLWASSIRASSPITGTGAPSTRGTHCAFHAATVADSRRDYRVLFAAWARVATRDANMDWNWTERVFAPVFSVIYSGPQFGEPKVALRKPRKPARRATSQARERATRGGLFGVAGQANGARLV